MAKKGGTKGSVSYDYHNLKPEQKAKVHALSETYPEAQKEHIAIVLQYYDFDQDLATDALTCDGGSVALNNWNMNSENNQAKTSSKNKKKNKKKNRRDNNGSSIGIAAQGTDAEDSSSLHSSNIDFDGEKESSSKLDYCDELAGKGDGDILNMCNSAINSSCNELEVPVAEDECSALGDRVETPEEGKSDDGLLPSLEVDFSEENVTENVERLSPKEQHNEEYMRHQHSKHLARQRHGSYHSKSSISEEPSSAPQTSNSLKNRSYVKSRKDLSRQIVSLQNIQLKLENRLEEAGKSLKHTFTEVRNLLDKRQAEVEAELDKAKQESLKLLKSRQDLATELKLRVDRASTAPDSEWTELRADIKQFVTERKYDELLGKTTWFVWSRDGIIEEINKFGEIAPVKNAYSQRSLYSRNQSSPEPSQLDSDVKNEDSELQEHADADIPVPSFGHEAGDAKVEKEVSTKMGQGENRSRIFCNRQFNRQNYGAGGRYNHNRGGRGGFFRQRGNLGNYPRGRQYENYRQFGGGERYDHRPQQYSQDRVDYRQGSMEEKSTEPRVSNINDGNNTASASYSHHPKDHQEHGRNQERRPYGGGGYRGGGGHHRSYNNNFQRNRFPNKPLRPHAEAVIGGGEGAVGDGNANYDQASHDKPDLVNGY